MAIVKMNNFSLFTFDSEKESLLKELQKFGYVHFTDLNAEDSILEEGLSELEPSRKLEQIEKEIQNVEYTIDLFKKYDTRDTGIKKMIKGLDTYTYEELEEKANLFDYNENFSEVKKITREIEEIDQSNVKLKALKEELHPWRNLQFNINTFENYKLVEIYTGFIPTKLKPSLNEEFKELEYSYIEFVNEIKGDSYFIAITPIEGDEYFEEILRTHSFSSINIPTESKPKDEIDKINLKLKENEVKKEEIKEKIDLLSKTLPDFEIVYEYLLNKKLRYASESKFQKTDKVNIIEGYIPKDKEDTFRDSVKSSIESPYFLEVEEAERDNDDVPIMLKNSKFAEAFESLTTMYALPKYNGIDPTPLLAPFFLAFFGMMVGDLGYGIILMLGTLFALKKFNLGKSQKLFIRFGFFLSFGAMAWGLIYGSFFGGIIPMKGLIEPSSEFNKLLIVSIIFGGIHLFYALGIKAYVEIRDGKPLAAVYDVGFWYLALMGSIGLLLNFVIDVPSVVGTVSIVAMVVGMVGIVLTGGRDSDSIGGRLGGGLYSLYGITGYIGDFVSYSRLMALGLSGGFIAAAINMIVDMLFGLGIPGIVIGVIVFIGGQLFNLFLSALSAYVHASRLTYVEFFGKFYEGGGKGFKTFRNKSKYINIE